METPTWGSPLDPLLVAFALLPSEVLARASLVCKAWHTLLLHSTKPWEAALLREFGYVPQSAPDRQAARQLLIAARTSRLFLAGQNALPSCSRTTSSGRFTVPELLLLPDADAAIAGDEQGGRDAPLAPHLHLPCLSIKAVAAGADFAVLLTWDGRVLDTRCLDAAAPTPGGYQERRQQGSLHWSGLWCPPAARAISVAAGGFWQGKEQGSGRPSGHVLVVTDEHAVWAWGSNVAGQLGLGCTNTCRASAGGSTSRGAAQAWVAAPLEVVDSVAAAAMGHPCAAACGEEHSMLLSRSGKLFASGSNAAGACGLPVVQLCASEFCRVPMPPAETAAVVSCGGRNTAVVTASGRLLVCGSNKHGQGGVGRAGGSCYLLADVGPSTAWHGMQRTNQLKCGGFGEVAVGQGATAVACGSGSMYVATEQGEVFAWGQGGQGELGLGSSSKAVGVPTRMPWAKDAACLAASHGGRFAAVIDEHGKLFTFGAGKSGALGHGDTAKKAVGRQVKALQSCRVHAVACGADWMLVVAGWKPAQAGKADRGGGGRKAAAQPVVPIGQEDILQPAGEQSVDDAPQCSFRYVKVEPPPPPRLPRHHSSWPGYPSSAMPALQPATPPGPGRRRSSKSNAADEGGGASPSSRLRNRSGREKRQEERRQEGRMRGHRGGSPPELPDAAPEMALARRQRWVAEPPAAASASSPPTSDCELERDSNNGSGGGARSGGSPRMDREMAYLLRCQLKAFTADPHQHQLVFPTSFSARDRWKVHVMAEAWGLMHESAGEGPRRKLVVWKPSRSRKSLMPSMLEERAASSSSGSSSKRDGDDDW